MAMNSVDGALVQNLYNLSSQNIVQRQNAEEYFQILGRNRNLSVVLLQILGDQSTDYNLKYHAVIVLCNFVKKCWGIMQPEPGIIYEEKCHIKEKVPQLAITSNRNIASFLRDILNIIVDYDTLDNFPMLGMVLSKCGQFADPYGNLMIFELAHSICKKYRIQIKSENLWLEIRTMLDSISYNINSFAEIIYNNLPKEFPINGAGIDMESLQIFCKTIMRLLDVYNDLIFQELPEEFVMQIDLWMNFLYKILADGVFDMSFISESDIRNQLMIYVTKIKLRVIRILNLFIGKYEADIRVYVKNFLPLVYRSVSTATSRNEKFSSACIEFFNRIVSTMEFKDLLSSQDDIRGLITEIIKPNISLTEYDYEMFEYNPSDFITKDMDRRSDTSNRKAVMDLISNLMTNSEKLVAGLLCKEVEVMIALSTNGSGAQFNVRDVSTLDTAIFLLSTVLTKKRHPVKGVLQVNLSIKLSEYINNLFCPILLSADRMHPLVVADSLKFVCTFYKFVSKELLSRTLPVVLRLFSTEHEVIFTYICMLLSEVYIESKNNGPVFYLELIETNLDEILQRIAQKLMLNEHCGQLLIKMMLYYNVSIKLVTLRTILQQLVWFCSNISNDATPPSIRVLFECMCLSMWVIRSANESYFSQVEPDILNIVLKNIKENNAALVDYFYQLLGLLFKLHSNGNIYHQAMLGLLQTDIFLTTVCASGLCIVIGDYASSFNELAFGIDTYQHLLNCFRICLSRSQDDRFSYILPKTFIARAPLHETGPQLNQLFLMYAEKFNGSYSKPLVKGFIHLVLQVFIISDEPTVMYLLNTMGNNFYWTFLAKIVYFELIGDSSDTLYKKLVEMLTCYALTGGISTLRINNPKLWCDLLNILIASVWNNKEILNKNITTPTNSTEGDMFNRLTYSAIQSMPFSSREVPENKFITTDVIKNFDIKLHLQNIVQHADVLPNIRTIMLESNKKYYRQIA